MSGGEVEPPTWSVNRRRHRLAQGVLACAVLLIVGLVVFGWQKRSPDFDDANARTRQVSQMVGALVAYTIEENAKEDQYPTFLADRFGKDVTDRYALITRTADPNASDTVLIERPEMVEGDWCLAAFGDAHVKKLRPTDAAEIIRAADKASPVRPAVEGGGR